VADKLALGFSLGHSSRDGFTVNDMTGNDLDSRSALFSKTQLLWTPASNWEARAIVTTERARDGDYALNDLDALRANPHHAARDYEGYTNRDIVAPTFLLSRTGSGIDLTATTGFVSWETEDATDLDYSPYPLATRVNNEQDFQFTQEVRVASAKARRVSLSDTMTLKWQAGGSFFTQAYDQEAVNSYSPFVLSQFVGFPVSQLSPQAELDDRGFGLYGETTVGFGPRFDATVALRGDFEHKEANLLTSFTPAIAPPTIVIAEDDFNDVSPQFSAAYRLSSDHTLYATAAKGFKAGGFNPASPAGGEAYGEEHSWNYEGGIKTLMFDRRMSMNATFYHLDWSDMQVNLPDPFVPGQFYISNAAGAASTGIELEMNARLAPGCDFFAGLGYANATFGDDSLSGGVPVAGNRLSNTPNYTADFGGQYTVAVSSSLNVYGRADISFKGGMYYDDANTEQQDAYSLSNFRAGVRGRQLFAEAWLRNAFDTKYIPLAFAYPGLAPSGFVGENGAPRTFGIRAGVSF
jgi:iron complex outermembrane receptor protein